MTFSSLCQVTASLPPFCCGRQMNWKIYFNFNPNSRCELCCYLIILSVSLVFCFKHKDV